MLVRLRRAGWPRSTPSAASCLRSGYALLPTRHRRHDQGGRCPIRSGAADFTKPGGKARRRSRVNAPCRLTADRPDRGPLGDHPSMKACTPGLSGLALPFWRTCAGTRSGRVGVGRAVRHSPLGIRTMCRCVGQGGAAVARARQSERTFGSGQRGRCAARVARLRWHRGHLCCLHLAGQRSAARDRHYERFVRRRGGV